jgi:hypothetical protein
MKNLEVETELPQATRKATAVEAAGRQRTGKLVR